MMLRTIALILCSWTSVAPKCFGCADDLSSELAAIVEHHVENSGFMGSVLVVREDEPLLRAGFGMANLEHNVPNTPTTKFRIGSVSKQFTAAGILLLAEWGDLSLRGAVEDYLDGIPPEWSEVTIHSLLTHTSGMPNFTSFEQYPQVKMFPTTPRQMMSQWIELPLDFSPGMSWAYSNSGYVTLAAIIEELSDESWEQFLVNNLLTPLDLHNTGHDSNQAIIPDRAQGYEITEDGFVNSEYINMEVPIGGGDIYSTVDDLRRWAEAVYYGELLGEELTSQMLTPVKNDYGYGVTIDRLHGERRIQHSGGIEGFVSELAHYPDAKVTVVALSNSGCPATLEIASALAKQTLAAAAASR